MNGRQNDDGVELALTVWGVAACVVSAPAFAAGWVLASRMAARRGSLALCALVGLGITLLLAPVIAGEMAEGLQAAKAARSEGTEATVVAIAPSVLTWWAEALVLTPVFALAIAVVRQPTVEQLRARRAGRESGARRRRERRARRAVGVAPAQRRPAGFELGRHLEGDPLLPVSLGRARMPLERMRKTTLVRVSEELCVRPGRLGSCVSRAVGLRSGS